MMFCGRSDFSVAARTQVFGPAFRRQSRWSVVTPVRELGDDKAAAKAVDDFYSFWFNFKSWREFPHPDEEDVEQAEGREHRCGPYACFWIYAVQQEEAHGRPNIQQAVSSLMFAVLTVSHERYASARISRIR